MRHISPRSLIATTLILASGYSLSGCAAAPAADGGQPSVASNAVSAPGKNEPGVTANCRPDATEMSGPYRFNNNQWGRKKARGGAEQCLLTREVAGHSERGWTWNWPGVDPTVFAYPEIEFGWKPWSGGKSTDRRLPVKIADLPPLLLSYEVETVADGSYDLAPEVWLMSGPGPFEAADPKSITTEVMFWMEYAGDARPAGEVIEHTQLDGIDYELWNADSIGQDANGKGWRLLSFKSQQIRRKGALPIHTLLKHLVDLHLVNPNDYLGSVEFGNEVMGGTGTTWVKRFDVSVGAP